MYSIEEMKVFLSNSMVMLETLNSRLNVDISNSCYFEDESVSVQLKTDTFILDIGTSVSGFYDYYYKNHDTEIEITADYRKIIDLHSDPVIKCINKLYPLT
jgi:hypothetical protein